MGEINSLPHLFYKKDNIFLMRCTILSIHIYTIKKRDEENQENGSDWFSSNLGYRGWPLQAERLGPFPWWGNPGMALPVFRMGLKSTFSPRRMELALEWLPWQLWELNRVVAGRHYRLLPWLLLIPGCCSFLCWRDAGLNDNLSINSRIGVV